MYVYIIFLLSNIYNILINSFSLPKYFNHNFDYLLTGWSTLTFRKFFTGIPRIHDVLTGMRSTQVIQIIVCELNESALIL